MIISGVVSAPRLPHHCCVSNRHAATHDFAEALTQRPVGKNWSLRTSYYGEQLYNTRLEH